MIFLRFSQLFFLGSLILFHTTGFAYQGDGINGIIIEAHGGPIGTTCASCHPGTPYGTPAVAHTGSTSVTHNSNTAYSIGLSGSTAQRVGINMAIYNDSIVMQSGFTTSDPGLVAVGNELSHPSPQLANKVWAYNWTAPSTTGAYTLYYCINQVNNDGLAFDELDGPNRCGTRVISVINNPPNAINDDNLTSSTLDVTQNGSFTNFNVCSNDATTESDAFSYLSNTALSGTGTLTRGTDCNFSFDTSNIFNALDSGEVVTRSFTYTIRENAPHTTDCTASFTATCADTATVTISINGANDAPLAVADSITVNEGATATQLDSTATNVLTNDTDVDIEALTAQLVTGPANASFFTLNTDGTFSYTHNGTETTSDSFSYRAQDGTTNSNTVTVSILITPQNDNPVAINDSATVAEGSSITINIIANDTDTELASLSVFNLGSASSGSLINNNNGTITYTNNGSETLSDSFTYFAHDGVFASLTPATVSLTINPVNDPPLIVSAAITAATESVAYNYQLSVTDPDDSNNGSNLFYNLTGAPTGMSVSTTGLISWTPPQTNIFNNLTLPITVTVSDGGENSAAQATQKFSITVNPPDADADMFADYIDNCVDIANPDQRNADSDTLGDACDADADGNAILDTYIIFNVVQNGNSNLVFQNDGNVRVYANLAVAGSGNETYNWNNTSLTLLSASSAISDNMFEFDPSALALGVYHVDVIITDQNNTLHNTVLIKILADTPPTLTLDDIDNDGVEDLTEGFIDSDNDGIPDYLDDSSDREFLPTQSINFLTQRNLQSSSGTFLALGDAAIAAGHYGALISADDLAKYGGLYASATDFASDPGYIVISEIFDFTVSGVTTGGTVNIVLPLSSGLRNGAQYRKFSPTPGSSWEDFTVDNNNQLSSAHSVAGICPAPGSSLYQSGLHPFTHCIQLTISDGGPNDADGEINGIVRDPGVVVIPSASASNSPDCAATVFNNCPQQGGSIGIMHTKFLLLLLSLLLAYRLHRRIK